MTRWPARATTGPSTAIARRPPAGPAPTCGSRWPIRPTRRSSCGPRCPRSSRGPTSPNPAPRPGRRDPGRRGSRSRGGHPRRAVAVVAHQRQRGDAPLDGAGHRRGPQGHHRRGRRRSRRGRPLVLLRRPGPALARPAGGLELRRQRPVPPHRADHGRGAPRCPRHQRAAQRRGVPHLRRPRRPAAGPAHRTDAGLGGRPDPHPERADPLGPTHQPRAHVGVVHPGAVRRGRVGPEAPPGWRWSGRPPARGRGIGRARCAPPPPWSVSRSPRRP